MEIAKLIEKADWWIELEGRTVYYGDGYALALNSDGGVEFIGLSL